MKKSRIAVLAIALMMIVGTMSVFAADDEEFSYKMTISPGNGSFTPELGDVNITSIEVTTGENAVLKINGGDPINIEPPTPNHFVTGVKVAGHDNDDLVGTQTLGDEDVEYVIAYGLKSNMVKYIVRYRDAATGGPVSGLPESEEFFGVSGDKPVISWRYADGYLPQAYRLTGELSGEKEFTFWYYKVDAQGNIITVVDGAPAGAAAAAAAAAGGPDGAGVVIGDDDTPLADGPQDTVDIDNNQSPTTDPSNIDDNETPGALWKTVGIGAGAIALIAIAALLIARRRRGEEEGEEIQ